MLQIKHTLVILLMSLCTLHVQAQINNATKEPTDGIWATGGHWSDDQNPPTYDLPVTPNTTETYTVSEKTSFELEENLIIRDGATVIIADEGELDAKDFDITIASSGTLIVKGTLSGVGKITLLGAISNAKFARLTIDGGTVTAESMEIKAPAPSVTSDETTFEMIANANGNLTITQDFINHSGSSSIQIGASNTMNVDGNFTNEEGAAFVNDGTLNIGGNLVNKKDATIDNNTNNSVINITGDLENEVDATIDNTNGTIDVDGNINDNGTITGNTPLPIELIFFRAEEQNGQILLYWATASEDDNDFFTIERASHDGEFEIILSEEGAGNSIHRIDYKTIDAEPLQGINYYRLKQTDFDGTYEYSKVIAVQVGERDHELDLSAYPNPTSDVVNVALPQNLSRNAQLSVVSLQGKTMMHENVAQSSGGLLNLSLAHLPKGVYLLKLVDEAQVETRKIIIK